MNKTKGKQFAGVTIALVTPFRDGKVDFDNLGRLVDWHVEQGSDCLAPVGTTGESPTLDHEEHERVIATVVERAAGRIKVMAGTGSNSTREAIRLTKFARRAGADGALMVGPYYNKPTQEGYYRHFKAVTEAVDLPIVLYNIPGRTGSNMLPETIARMAEIPTIVGIKEATGSLDQASQIAALCNLTILSGDDSLTLPLMSIGARGVVSVVGNIVPRDMKASSSGLRGRQGQRSGPASPAAVPAVPRPAGGGYQSDTDKDGHETAGTGNWRVAAADVPAGCGGGGEDTADVAGLWVAVLIAISS